MITLKMPSKNSKIELTDTDLGPMTWDDANLASEKAGDGWRLPTTLELDTTLRYSFFIFAKL